MSPTWMFRTHEAEAARQAAARERRQRHGNCIRCGLTRDPESQQPVLSDGAAAYVAEKAVEWDQCRREAQRLRAERATFACEHEESADYGDDGRCHYEGTPTCWRNWWTDQHGRDRRPDISEWCEPCQKRQAVHEQYRAVVRRRGALLRQLQRRALAAFEQLAGDPR